MTTRQMVYMMLGAVAGLAVGIVCLLLTFHYVGPSFWDNAPLVLVVVAGLVVGGLVGGAYAVQAVIHRLEKRKRKSKKGRKEKRRR